MCLLCQANRGLDLLLNLEEGRPNKPQFKPWGFLEQPAAPYHIRPGKHMEMYL
jgi:hypothetical protein